MVFICVSFCLTRSCSKQLPLASFCDELSQQKLCCPSVENPSSRKLTAILIPATKMNQHAHDPAYDNLSRKLASHKAKSSCNSETNRKIADDCYLSCACPTSTSAPLLFVSEPPSLRFWCQESTTNTHVRNSSKLGQYAHDYRSCCVDLLFSDRQSAQVFNHTSVQGKTQFATVSTSASAGASHDSSLPMNATMLPARSHPAQTKWK